jgi:AraC-like DNA-binding protein
MAVQDLTLPVHYLRYLGEFVAPLGVDVPQLLARSGLGTVQLADPSYRVSWPVFRQLVVDALGMSREPALGLLAGQRLTLSTHGVLGFAAQNSDTIRQALGLIERYLLLRTTLLSVHHEVLPARDHQPAEVRVILTENWPLDEVRRPVHEAVVLALKNVLDHLTMGSCKISEVAFAFARPSYGELAEGLFKCAVRYNQPWTGLSLPLELLDVPLKMADPAAFAEAAQICQRELDKLEVGPALATKVRRVLLDQHNGFPSLVVTARLFHMTPRTLHRRLQEEGTSFAAILEDVRHMLALEHLKSDRLGVEEIGYLLGYTDLANFRRAFKRWEGVPPSLWRMGHLRGAP